MAEAPFVPRRLVLVVDDHPTGIRVVAEILRASYEVVFATNGQRALQVAASRDLDLVLLDVHLPDLHGYEVCRRLKADPRTRAVPVIFLTASDDPAHEAERLAAGAVETVHKPFAPALLLERIAIQLSAAGRH